MSAESTRPCIAIAAIAAMTLVHHAAGLGLTVVLIAVYAAAARRNVWWLLAAALAGVATLRAAAWVVVPAIAASPWSLVRGQRRRELAAGRARPGADRSPARRRRDRAAPRPGRPRAAWPCGRPRSRSCSSPSSSRCSRPPTPPSPTCSTRWCRWSPPTGRSRASLLWFGLVSLGGALIHADTARPAHATTRRLERGRARRPARHSRRPVRRLRRVPADDALRRQRVRPREVGGDVRRVRPLGLRATDRRRGADARGHRRRRPLWPAHRLRQALLGALIVLTFVILASAYTRLHLYEDAYGFTPAAARRRRGDPVARRPVRARPRRRYHQAHGWLPRAVLALSATGDPRVRAQQPGRADRRAQHRPLRAHRPHRPPHAAPPERGRRPRAGSLHH